MKKLIALLTLTLVVGGCRSVDWIAWFAPPPPPGPAIGPHPHPHPAPHPHHPGPHHPGPGPH